MRVSGGIGLNYRTSVTNNDVLEEELVGGAALSRGARAWRIVASTVAHVDYKGPESVDAMTSYR